MFEFGVGKVMTLYPIALSPSIGWSSLVFQVEGYALCLQPNHNKKQIQDLNTKHQKNLLQLL